MAYELSEDGWPTGQWGALSCALQGNCGTLHPCMRQAPINCRWASNAGVLNKILTSAPVQPLPEAGFCAGPGRLCLELQVVAANLLAYG
jgi:hypothetical protein